MNDPVIVLHKKSISSKIFLYNIMSEIKVKHIQQKKINNVNKKINLD